MAATAKVFTCTGQATKPQQREALTTHHNQLQLVIKASSWKRAHELYVTHQGPVSLAHLRQYGSITGNRTQLAISAEATEGIWWTTLNNYGSEGYHALWTQPAAATSLP